MSNSPVSLPSPFYFVRHGLTDYNRACLVMGQRDIPLNEEGRRQALSVAYLLQGRNILTIMTSSLARARETAEIIAAVLSVPVLLESALMERAWGIYEGYDRNLRPLNDKPVGGETLCQFFDRTLRGFNRMSEWPSPMLVVAHNGTCQVLRCHLSMSGSNNVVPNALPLYYEYTGHGWREQTINMI